MGYSIQSFVKALTKMLRDVLTSVAPSSFSIAVNESASAKLSTAMAKKTLSNISVEEKKEKMVNLVRSW